MSSPERIVVGEVDLQDAAERWARGRYVPAARVRDLAPMPGNSGLSFGFTVTGPDGADLDAVVLRLAPPGVRREGNTDVLRQVPLLAALEGARVPVAPVLWSTSDPSWFGTDAVVQPLLRGMPLHMYETAAGVDPGPDGGSVHLRQAVDVLAAVHGVDWQRLLPEWERPRGVDEELDRWAPLLERAGDADSIDAGRRLRRQLSAGAPAEVPIGLFHGDFQTNNVLFDPDDGDLLAVIDWEIAGIGPQLLDLGWLAMMTDLEPWGPEQRARMKVVADPGRLRDRYEQARGTVVGHFDWYRAMAAYRFGVIVAFNLRLHRTGRRVDPSYELLASSVPTLFAHGTRLTAR